MLIRIVMLLLLAAPATGRNLFLHHSVGRLMTAHMRTLVPALWDHDYNYIGLSDAQGVLLGRSYGIPGDNTYPDGLNILFNNASAARDSLLLYDTVILKSCYPTCGIPSDELLQDVEQQYTSLLAALGTLPNRFVLCTPPPLHRLSSTAGQAQRCLQLCGWLLQQAPPNVAVFDLHSVLCDDAGLLRYEYERSHTDGDSHPNDAGSLAAAQALAAAVNGSTGVEPQPFTWGNVKAMWR